jgi:RHS repeat-associated protein
LDIFDLTLESGLIYNGVNVALASGTGGNRGNSQPAAYLNFILFDKDYKVLDLGFQPATGLNVKTKISFPTKTIKEAGYLFVWLSYENESNNYVQFDDLKITHTKTNIIQYNEYYPFGLQAGTSWTRDQTTGNNYLYDAANELNTTTSWYETFFRNYDPVIGRFTSIDPLATKYAPLSGYSYAFNNPVMFIFQAVCKFKNRSM